MNDIGRKASKISYKKSRSLGTEKPISEDILKYMEANKDNVSMQPIYPEDRSFSSGSAFGNYSFHESQAAMKSEQSQKQ